MTNHPQSSNDGVVYTGRPVIDEQGNQIGKVTDVIYDDEAVQAFGALPEPAWLVVDRGLLRSAHYMPVAGSYRTADGLIVSPWDREWVKAADKAVADHVLTREQRDRLLHHYALAD